MPGPLLVHCNGLFVANNFHNRIQLLICELEPQDERRASNTPSPEMCAIPSKETPWGWFRHSSYFQHIRIGPAARLSQRSIVILELYGSLQVGEPRLRPGVDVARGPEPIERAPLLCGT